MLGLSFLLGDMSSECNFCKFSLGLWLFFFRYFVYLKRTRHMLNKNTCLRFAQKQNEQFLMLQALPLVDLPLSLQDLNAYSCIQHVI